VIFLMIMCASMQNIEPKDSVPKINVAVGVIKDGQDRVLIAKRKAHVHQGGLWEFSGGKFEAGENAESALSRELLEELNIKPIKTSPLIELSFAYPEINVRLHVYEVHAFIGEVIAREGQVIKWVAKSELDHYAFPEANKAILTAIKLGRQYAIINGSNIKQVLQDLDDVSAQGVGVVQIRAKHLNAQDAEQLISAVKAKCNVLQLNYLFNSQNIVAKTSGAGMHLTSSDLMRLKRRPESSGFVAASCHSLQELRRAEQLGLDFVVLSPVNKTASHPDASPLGWLKFTQWVAGVNLPVFALGGVNKEDYDLSLSSGAQGISGIRLFKVNK